MLSSTCSTVSPAWQQAAWHVRANSKSQGGTCPVAPPPSPPLPSPVSRPLSGLMGASEGPFAAAPGVGAALGANPGEGPCANALTGASIAARSSGGGRGFFADARGGSTRCAGVMRPPASASPPGDACQQRKIILIEYDAAAACPRCLMLTYLCLLRTKCFHCQGPFA